MRNTRSRSAIGAVVLFMECAPANPVPFDLALMMMQRLFVATQGESAKIVRAFRNFARCCNRTHEKAVQNAIRAMERQVSYRMFVAEGSRKSLVGVVEEYWHKAPYSKDALYATLLQLARHSSDAVLEETGLAKLLEDYAAEQREGYYLSALEAACDARKGGARGHAFREMTEMIASA